MREYERNCSRPMITNTHHVYSFQNSSVAFTMLDEFQLLYCPAYKSICHITSGKESCCNKQQKKIGFAWELCPCLGRVGGIYTTGKVIPLNLFTNFFSELGDFQNTIGSFWQCRWGYPNLLQKVLIEWLVLSGWHLTDGERCSICADLIFFCTTD